MLLETAATGGASMFMPIILLVLMFVVMYFLIIRPQKKKDKQAAEMRNSLQVGDEVVTIGGIIGRVVVLKDEDVYKRQLLYSRQYTSLHFLNLANVCFASHSLQ